MTTPNVTSSPSQTPKSTSATGSAAPTQTSEKDAKLTATRAKIIQAYSDNLPLQGEAKQKEVERFSKLLDPNKLELVLYAKAGESGYMFKADLAKLLEKLGGANSAKGSAFVNALVNEQGLNFGIPALLGKETETAAPAQTVAAQPSSADTAAPANSASSALAVKIADVAISQEIKTAFDKGEITWESISKASMTKDLIAIASSLTLSSLMKDETFKTACPTFATSFEADKATKTVSELLTAAKQELSSASDTAKAKPYLDAIEKLLAAEKSLTPTANTTQ
jgi:hypothetical protein